MPAADPGVDPVVVGRLVRILTTDGATACPACAPSSTASRPPRPRYGDGGGQAATGCPPGLPESPPRLRLVGDGRCPGLRPAGAWNPRHDRVPVPVLAGVQRAADQPEPFPEADEAVPTAGTR
ncbi:hypothetical protein GCM10027290_19850 [Micromonospora sonneratiae]